VGIYAYVVHPVFGDENSMNVRAYYLARLYLWVAFGALVDAAVFSVGAEGAARLTKGLVGLVVGAFAGFIIGGVHISIIFGVHALRTWLDKTFGPLGGIAVLGGFGVGMSTWALWTRSFGVNAHSILGGAIAGLIFVVVIATIAWSSSGRSRE
jgi:hypothetical protein